jgi:hypothetical protein
MKVKVSKTLRKRYNDDNVRILRKLAETGELYEVDTSYVRSDNVILKPIPSFIPVHVLVYNVDIEVNIDDFREGLMGCDRCGHYSYLDKCADCEYPTSSPVLRGSARKSFNIPFMVAKKLRFLMANPV